MLPESPVYLMSMGRYDELISTFKKLARHNKVQDELTVTKEELETTLSPAHSQTDGSNAQEAPSTMYFLR